VSSLDPGRMAVNTGILVVMLWTTFQSAVSQIELPSTIGGSCGTNERCKKYIENSACVNSVCTCVPKYVPNSANKVCIPVVANINDPCEESIQCTESFGSNAECNSTKVCSCKSAHHIVSPAMKCIPSKGLDETCTDSTECYLLEDGSDQHVECAENQCKCTEGYNRTPENKSCYGSAVTKIISITCLVGVWILHLLV